MAQEVHKAHQIDQFLYKPEGVDSQKYIIATYHIKSSQFDAAARALAIGQSLGNPEHRTSREGADIYERSLARVLHSKDELNGMDEGTVRIAFPVGNFGPGDGINQLLCHLMGGQMDIDMIKKCRLEGLVLPDSYIDSEYKGPQFGMEYIKKATNAEGRPLLGGIVKPKTGVSPEEVRDMVIDLFRGGCDFVKEDEILGNPIFCDFYDRVPSIAAAVRKEEKEQDRQLFYAPCINSNPREAYSRAEFAAEKGARAVHLNFWAGLGTYQDIRDMDLPLALFFQRSGIEVWTHKNHDFAVDWPVMCQLARMIGPDFIHAGMFGGYKNDSVEGLQSALKELRDGDRFNATVPSLSCGSHPGLAHATVHHLGDRVMMSAGGRIHDHPDGTVEGAKAFRQAFEHVKEHKERGVSMADYMKRSGNEALRKAVETWGYLNPANNQFELKKE